MQRVADLDEHAAVLAMMLAVIDHYTAQIDQLTAANKVTIQAIDPATGEFLAATA
jgi:hypothetical protein